MQLNEQGNALACVGNGVILYCHENESVHATFHMNQYMRLSTQQQDSGAGEGLQENCDEAHCCKLCSAIHYRWWNTAVLAALPTCLSRRRHALKKQSDIACPGTLRELPVHLQHKHLNEDCNILTSTLSSPDELHGS
jgi:hypothetical protein